MHKMINFKPTEKKPVNNQSKNFEKNFNKEMIKHNVKLNEIDNNLKEEEQSLKKKIFKLNKMEALVFSDPKLSAIYEEMAENGETRFGYHYNETIMNILFNDYVLNSSKYLAKYKQAVPQKKKRRDKSGIEAAKKIGAEKMDKNTNTEIKEYVDKIDNPNDNDCFIISNSSKYDIKCNGKIINTFDNFNDALIAINDWKSENELNTNTWYISEIGNISLIDENGNFLTETTTASSAGGSAGYVGYAGPAAWSKNGKPINRAIYVGGTVIAESNYLVDSKGFEEYINLLNEQSDIDYIEHNSEAYGSLNNMNDDNINIIKNDIKNKKMDEVKVDVGNMPIFNKEIRTGKPDKGDCIIKSENGKFVSSCFNKLIGTYDSISDAIDAIDDRQREAKSFPYVWFQSDTGKFTILNGEHAALNEKINNIDEESETMIGDNPSTMALKPTSVDQSNMPRGMEINENNMDELKKINEELDEFIAFHNELKSLDEDRKQSSLILKDRLGSENQKNFKSDLNNSGTKKVINIEKELQWKEQQTNVGDNPQKLAQTIEKESLKKTKGESFKNVGNSSNLKGDEIPKRNLTDEEMDEVQKYRLGMEDWVYDNLPDKRFEDRMKKDMGDEKYKERNEKLEFRAKAPMYNKDTQPIENGDKKVQFNKDKSKWNNRNGINESLTGKYINELNKQILIDFNINDVISINENININDLFKIDFIGLGNTLDKRGKINESISNIIDNNNFYTDGILIYADEKKISIDENIQINDNEYDKIKHLLKYNPNEFVNTKNVKNNRGF